MTWALALLAAAFIAAFGVTWLRARAAAHRAHVLALIAQYENPCEHEQAIITQALVDEADYIVGDRVPWLYGGPSRPWPCCHEDNYCSGECLDLPEPQGRHHAPPLRYGPEPIVGGCITDLPEPSDPRWSQ